MSILSNSTEQVLQSASSLSMEKQNVDITVSSKIGFFSNFV